jgi:hypothetical protein
VSCQGTVGFEAFGDNLVVRAREHFASGEGLLTDRPVGESALAGPGFRAIPPGAAAQTPESLETAAVGRLRPLGVWRRHWLQVCLSERSVDIGHGGGPN